MSELTVENISIRQDQDGLFCLNDLHKASGLGRHKLPSKWLATKEAQESVKDVEADFLAENTQNPNSGSALKINNGGTQQGIYACEELMLEYAAWLERKFRRRVYKAIKELTHGYLENAKSALHGVEPSNQLADLTGKVTEIGNAISTDADRVCLELDQLNTLGSDWGSAGVAIRRQKKAAKAEVQRISNHLQPKLFN